MIEKKDEVFLVPPLILEAPHKNFLFASRKFQGISSITITSDNTLWAIWYAGPNPAEDEHNYVVLAKSQDDGKTWVECLIITSKTGSPCRVFDPEIWTAPSGQLFVFWSQSIGHIGTIAGVWLLEITKYEKNKLTFKKPIRVTDGIMMCKPIALSTDEWVLPASTWKETDNSARMIISNDQGLTWKLQGACHVKKEDREFDEHMILEKKDKSLVMFVRTKYGIGESTSIDTGKTWSELKPSKIQHPSSRFFIQKLQSGKILLIKHGKTINSFENQIILSEKSWIGRNNLTAWLSDDDGVCWHGGLMLDSRDGISYPDGVQSLNGTIYITYDYLRKNGEGQILFAKFTEEDILAKEKFSSHFLLKSLISSNN